MLMVNLCILLGVHIKSIENKIMEFLRMFRAYALDLDSITSLIENESCESIYEEVDREKINSSLKDFLKQKPHSLNGKKLMDLFFPSKNCPVFLSHSGLDDKRVTQFSQWLKRNFEINSFIDSDLWGCIKDLQWEIDQECKTNAGTKEQIVRYIQSRCSGNTFDYTERNYNTANVHIMLCHALTQMIDSAECFIFLGSSNSYSEQDGDKGTFSPWIFHELSTVNVIREHKIRDTVPEMLPELRCFSSLNESAGEKRIVQIFYPTPLERHALLKKTDLENWVKGMSDSGRCNDWYMDIAARLCNDVADGTIDAKEKWEKALNWLYKNCCEKVIGDEIRGNDK